LSNLFNATIKCYLITYLFRKLGIKSMSEGLSKTFKLATVALGVALAADAFVFGTLGMEAQLGHSGPIWNPQPGT
jgi:hypothetical protein